MEPVNKTIKAKPGEVYVSVDDSCFKTLPELNIMNYVLFEVPTFKSKSK
jgi:hypothetical protein